MQPPNQEPVKFFYPGIKRRTRLRLFLELAPSRFGPVRMFAGRSFRRPGPKHVGFESFERLRIRLVIELVRIRADEFPDPFLEERFLLELAQLRFFTGPGLRARFGRFRNRRAAFPSKHDPLIRTLRIVKSATHLHLDFVDDRLEIANASFHFSQVAEQWPKLPCSPANKVRLVLALESVPGDAQFLESPHRRSALRARGAA